MEKMVPIENKSKSFLRKDLLTRRKNFCGNNKLLADRKIEQAVTELSEYKNSKNIFLYASSKEEVDTSLIFEGAVNQGKHVFFPKVTGDGSMEFIHVKDKKQLGTGYKGIMEPLTDEYTELTPDIIIVPGVGFDKSFNRIGYGKGFYDRYLNDKGKNAIKVGLCYELQLLEKLPSEENDIQMDIIITEKGIWKKKIDS